MLQSLLGKLGIYYSKRRYMPYGVDWIWDLARLEPPITVRTVIDVGANEGQTVSAVTAAYPAAAVHAFEPVDATFTLLKSAFDGHPNVTVNRSAVSSAIGTARMDVAAYSPASRIVTGASASADSVVVDTVTLDAYCAAKAITHIDILKSDTEGHDLEVLKGARGLFEAGRIDWVLVEATFNADDDGHSQFVPMQEWLATHGMTPWCFYDQFHIDGGRRLMFFNVVFAKRTAPPLPAAGTVALG